MSDRELPYGWTQKDMDRQQAIKDKYDRLEAKAYADLQLARRPGDPPLEEDSDEVLEIEGRLYEKFKAEQAREFTPAQLRSQTEMFDRESAKFKQEAHWKRRRGEPLTEADRYALDEEDRREKEAKQQKYWDKRREDMAAGKIPAQKESEMKKPVPRPMADDDLDPKMREEAARFLGGDLSENNTRGPESSKELAARISKPKVAVVKEKPASMREKELALANMLFGKKKKGPTIFDQPLRAKAASMAVDLPEEVGSATTLSARKAAAHRALSR